jgi:hypothetical protein
MLGTLDFLQRDHRPVPGSLPGQVAENLRSGPAFNLQQEYAAVSCHGHSTIDGSEQD